MSSIGGGKVVERNCRRPVEVLAPSDSLVMLGKSPICSGTLVVDSKLSTVRGLLFMSSPSLAFLAFLASKPVWMDFTRVLMRRCCRETDIDSLYFTGNRDGSCVGFSIGRNIHFRFLKRQSLGWLVSYSGNCGCRPSCTATVWLLINDCFIDLYTFCRGQ